MGQKSLSGPSAVSIMESLLDMLARVLSPLVTEQAGTTTFTHLLEHRYVGFTKTVMYTISGHSTCIMFL